MRVLKIIHRIVLGGAALVWAPAAQAQSPSDFLAVRKVTLDPATSNMLVVVQNMGGRRITGCAVLAGSRQYTQEFVYSVGMDPKLLSSRPVGFGGLKPGETMQLLFPPSGSGGPPTAHINAVIFEDRTAVGEGEQIASMFRQRLAYASEWGRWALVMEEDPARPRSDVAREAEIAEMIRVLPEDPDKSGSAAAVAGRMAARRALRSLLMQSKPQTRAALLAYVQERAGMLQLHAQRAGWISSYAPQRVANTNVGPARVRPSVSEVRMTQSSCAYPGQPFGISGDADILQGDSGTAQGRSRPKVGRVAATATGICGVNGSVGWTSVPTCNPEFIATTSSSPSSATITAVTHLYVAPLGCTITISQTTTSPAPELSPADTSAAVTEEAQCCPTTVSVSQLTALNLPYDNLKTGIGAVTAMAVGPGPYNYNGVQIEETVTPRASTCPQSFGNQCSGSSTFTVGAGDSAFGRSFPDTSQVFYDWHTTTSTVSILDAAGIQSCWATCNQVYTCRRQANRLIHDQEGLQQDYYRRPEHDKSTGHKN